MKMEMKGNNSDKMKHIRMKDEKNKDEKIRQEKNEHEKNQQIKYIKYFKYLFLAIVIVTLVAVGFSACGSDYEDSSGAGNATENTAEGANEKADETADEEVDSDSAAAEKQGQSGQELKVPAYSGKPYVTVNNNKPKFDTKGITAGKAKKSFEKYGNLDRQGRCTRAVASLSDDTQPGYNEERGDISQIHPSGWRSGQGWERCHLIGWQLCAENDNARNLITGTHYMNVSGMLPFENDVDDYIERTGNHVLYEVTPVFKGKNSIASGVHMQAKSVEDKGRGISFNVYCYNVSPGEKINYKTGEVSGSSGSYASSGSSGSSSGSSNSNSGKDNYKRKYVINTNTGKFHYPSCSSVKRMSDHNKWVVNTTRKVIIKKGYDPCGMCEP